MSENTSTPIVGPLLLTTAQAAEALALSPRTIATLIEFGQLHVVRIGGAVRVPHTALIEIAQHGASLPPIQDRKATRDELRTERTRSLVRAERLLTKDELTVRDARKAKRHLDRADALELEINEVNGAA